MNKLEIGLLRDFENIQLPDGRFLLLHHQVPNLPRARRSVLFDPTKHSLNPCLNVDYHYATAFVDAVDAAFPRGDGTLTKDTGLDFIFKALLAQPASLQTLIPSPDKNSPPGQVWAYNKVQRILLSPTLSRVFDPRENQFNFNGSGTIVAHIDPAKITAFDALFLGLILIGRYKGQLVIPEFGFYGRDAHANLVRENRLIAGINYLGEVPLRLRQALILIKDKQGYGALHEDAELLARHRGFIPHTNQFNEAVEEAMA